MQVIPTLDILHAGQFDRIRVDLTFALSPPLDNPPLLRTLGPVHEVGDVFQGRQPTLSGPTSNRTPVGRHHKASQHRRLQLAYPQNRLAHSSSACWGSSSISRQASAVHGQSVVIVESPEGISPSGAPRTVREPLDSYGSRCSAVAMA